jgi:hypothetical protein
MTRRRLSLAPRARRPSPRSLRKHAPNGGACPWGGLEGQPATRIHDHLGDQAQPEVALGTAERGIESNSLVLGGPMPSLPWPPLATLLSEPDET